MEVIDAATCIGLRPDDDRLLGSEVLLAQMDRAGVAESLCTHFAAIRYNTHDGNGSLFEICRQVSCLHPVAVINPAPYVGVEADIEYCAREGCVGFRFTPGLQGWSLASEPFVRALQAMAPIRRPIAVELGSSGDATLVAKLTQGLDVPVVLADVTYATIGEAIAVMERHDHLLLEACRLATPGIVEILANAVGAKRLLFGSGAPSWEIAPTISIIRSAQISEAAKRGILGQNARRIYELPKRAGELP